MTSPVLLLLIASSVCEGLFAWDLIRSRREKHALANKTQSLRAGFLMTDADLKQHYIALAMQRTGLSFRMGGLFAAFGILLALWAIAFAFIDMHKVHRLYLTASNIILFLAYFAIEKIRNRKYGLFLNHLRTVKGAICPSCQSEFANGLKTTTCPKCGLPVRADVLSKAWLGDE